MIEHQHISIESERIEQSPEFDFAKEVVGLLSNAGFEAYFAGGYCRDLMLNLQPKDIDIATAAASEKVLEILNAHGINANYVSAAEAYPVVITRATTSDGQDVSFEIAAFRKDVYTETGQSRRPDTMQVGESITLEDDASRRDFTINALYFNPLTNQMIDPTGAGIHDVLDRKIAFVGDAAERIQEDRLRILRAVRFKNRFGFSYEETTKHALHTARGELLKISAERIQDELTKMFLLPGREQVLRDLDELDMLDLLLPEFTAGKGVEQPKEFHAEGDVFTHQLLVAKNLPEKVNKQLVWATLLHDIGKPHTGNVNEAERISFPGHDAESANLARNVLNRMKFSSSDIDHIVWLVENHMRVREMPKMKRSKQLAMIHPPYLSPASDGSLPIDNLLALLKSDNQSSLRPDGSVDQKSYNAIHTIVEQLRLEVPKELPTIKKDFGLDGLVFIKRFSINQKDRTALRQLGQLIRYLDEKYQNKELESKEKALEAADQYWGTLTNH